MELKEHRNGKASQMKVDLEVKSGSNHFSSFAWVKILSKNSCHFPSSPEVCKYVSFTRDDFYLSRQHAVNSR